MHLLGKKLGVAESLGSSFRQCDHSKLFNARVKLDPADSHDLDYSTALKLFCDVSLWKEIGISQIIVLL